MTDATSYAIGQVVKLTTSLRNRSATTCYFNGYGLTMSFLDPGGKVLTAINVIADDIQYRPFVPGQVLTHSVPWDPHTCQFQPCSEPSGVYSVQAKWGFSGGTYGATLEFIVR